LIFDNSTAFPWSQYPARNPPSLNGQQEPYLPRDSNPLHTADSSFADLPILLREAIDIGRNGVKLGISEVCP
jgi:hypothetical protein